MTEVEQGIYKDTGRYSHLLCGILKTLGRHREVKVNDASDINAIVFFVCIIYLKSFSI